jgi:flagellar hook-associated protein 2
MAGDISIGGLMTGLDTNSIIAKLVQLETRPISLLQSEQSGVEKTKTAIASLNAKLLTFKSAADALKTSAKVLVRAASSSSESVATVAAGEGAQKGTATLNVTRLARGSVAGSTVGKTAADDTVAAGAGTFRFQVGSGAVQSVAVDATTTLQDLATAIGDLDAGVSASVINFGTDAAPNYRLQIASTATGASSTITVVQDDTSLAIQTGQTGLNAQFTLSGFSTTFERESNTFSDVLSGVTIALKDEGTTTITVDDDADAITAKVKALVTAYNDIRTFVTEQSAVSGEQGADTITSGPLANNSTVRSLVQQLQETLTGAISGASTRYVNLASVGLATQRDGTILFTESTFQDALADDPTAVAQVLAGNGTANGVANDLSTLLGSLTGAGGAIATQNTSLDQRVDALQDQIDTATRNLEAFEKSLRAQFSALETLVASLQSQGNSLLAALGR